MADIDRSRVEQYCALRAEHVELQAEHALAEEVHGEATGMLDRLLAECRLLALEERMGRLEAAASRLLDLRDGGAA